MLDWLVHSILSDYLLERWIHASADELLAAVDEVGQHLTQLLVDRLDAINGDQSHLLGRVCFEAKLFELKLSHTVVNFDQFLKAPLFNKLIECYTRQLFILYQSQKFGNVCEKSWDYCQELCLVELSGELDKLLNHFVDVFDVGYCQLSVSLLVLRDHRIDTVTTSPVWSPVIPHDLQQAVNVQVVLVYESQVFAVVVYVLFDLLAGFLETSLYIGRKVWSKQCWDFLELVSSHYALINHEFLVCEELICDFVIALVEGSHEARENLELTWPFFCNAECFLRWPPCAFKQADVLSNNQHIRNQVWPELSCLFNPILITSDSRVDHIFLICFHWKYKGLINQVEQVKILNL